MGMWRQNRRSEPRHYCYGKRMGWRAQGSTHRKRKGWLNDVSDSGLSFLVEADSSPSAGEDVELTVGGVRDQNLCYVVRVQRLEGNLALIGCRKYTTTPSSLPPRTPPQVHTRQASESGARFMGNTHNGIG